MALSKNQKARAERLEKLFGMSAGAAWHLLRKTLLFSMAKELGRLECFRCGAPIKIIAEFSTEHVLSWENHPDGAALFFDLANIKFSHLRCNVEARAKPPKTYPDQRSKKLAECARRQADPKLREAHLKQKRDAYARKNGVVRPYKKKGGGEGGHRTPK